MFVAVVMTLALASCGAKTEKAAENLDSLTNEVNAAIDTLGAVVAPADSIVK